MKQIFSLHAKRNMQGRSFLSCFSLLLCSLLILGCMAQCTSEKKIYCVASADNNLVGLLTDDGYTVISFPTIQEALKSVPDHNTLLLLASEYPDKVGHIDRATIDEIARKQLNVYAEYMTIDADTICRPQVIDLERVVVTDTTMFASLPYLSLLTINASYYLPAQSVENPLLVTAKVAGFDKAEFGLANTPTQPLLYYYNDQILVATAPLSHFALRRFMPEQSWQTVWETVLTRLTGEETTFSSWPTYVAPTYSRNESLPQAARKQSVEKGIEWFFNGCFLIHPSWAEDWVSKYMGDGSMPIGPELPGDFPVGDGSMGMLEGHCSYIYYDGTQKYRYWLRDDVQGESAMAFALGGKLLGNDDYYQIARNLNNYSFEAFRTDERNDPKSPSYGLLSWSRTNLGVYYGDDNARSFLGSLVAAAVMDDSQWTKKLVEVIAANFRTTGKNGFRGERLEDKNIQKNGWQYYWNGDKINPHPHFEAWPWACYLWMYSQTGYEPLLERTRKAIRITMESYPDRWGWTNGIQQERARMILPLAWLVRVEPTEENKQWLDFMVKELLKNQVESGCIREELGDPATGMFGRPKSNESYGKHEAPLIFNNGDPIADMLYTNNFAFVGLNEAAKATNNPEYVEAVNKLSDFLTRVQVRSEQVKNVDGAWLRAFNYSNWDFWASNADAGWGAWSTLTGWIQSWILGTQSLMEMNTSIWDITKDFPVQAEWEEVKKDMIEK